MNQSLTDPRELKALLARHGVHLSRRLGQNFLIADWVPRQVAEAAALDRTCGVLEIGPGVGSLTVQLCQRAQKVAAVELDRALLPVLAETLAPYPNAEVIPGDVMQLDLPALVRARFPGLTVKVCANLPYSITTPVLTRLLEAGCFAGITVMIQREVACRVCAAPGSAACGAFSLFCQYHAACEMLFDVPGACFFPAPKVTSTVVRLTPRAAPPVEGDPDALFRVIRAAFAQRRKTLCNSLAAALVPQRAKEDIQRAIAACGLPADVRGERLGLEEFARLTRALSPL